jgi:hypothetical protein
MIGFHELGWAHKRLPPSQKREAGETIIPNPDIIRQGTFTTHAEKDKLEPMRWSGDAMAIDPWRKQKDP